MRADLKDNNIAYFAGKKVDDMSKSELIRALNIMGNLYKKCLDEKKRERNLIVSLK